MPNSRSSRKFHVGLLLLIVAGFVALGCVTLYWLAQVQFSSPRVGGRLLIKGYLLEERAKTGQWPQDLSGLAVYISPKYNADEAGREYLLKMKPTIRDIRQTPSTFECIVVYSDGETQRVELEYHEREYGDAVPNGER